MLNKRHKSSVAVNKESLTTVKEKLADINRAEISEMNKENIQYDKGQKPSADENKSTKATQCADEEQPSVTDFDTYFPWACRQFCIEKSIIIKRIIQPDYKKIKEKKGKGSLAAMPSTSMYGMKSTTERKSQKPPEVRSSERFSLIDLEGTWLSVHTYYTGEHLQQIKFHRNTSIPPKTIKIIGLITQFYPYLSSIIINQGLNVGVLYHLSQLLLVSFISEITLDDCYLPELSYHILLDNPGQLSYLSLARCKINDEAVKAIFDKLVYPLPASQTISVLNLSTNMITDEGAGYIASALRANRQLKYLNLTHNYLTDDGAISILSMLKDFPLTDEERETSGSKYIQYAKKKSDIVARYLRDMKVRKPSATIKKGKSSTSTSRMSTTNTAMSESTFISKAETVAKSILGEYVDPYSRSDTVAINGVLHCVGNNALCYLNLSYNSLGMFTVKTLLEVLQRQKVLNRKPMGLVNVRIDGNPMPDACKELVEINDILELALLTAVRKKRKPDMSVLNARKDR